MDHAVRRNDNLMVAQSGNIECRTTHVTDNNVWFVGKGKSGHWSKGWTRHDRVNRLSDHFCNRHHTANAIGQQQFTTEIGFVEC